MLIALLVYYPKASATVIKGPSEKYIKNYNIHHIIIEVFDNLLSGENASEENNLAKIRQVFTSHEVGFSDQFTINQRAWFITHIGIPVYELTKRENDNSCFFSTSTLKQVTTPQAEKKAYL